jgi:phage-related baseplate assembly protein
VSGFTAIDLSKLPAPAVIETVGFDDLLAEMKVAAIAYMPELATYLALESEPTTQLLRVCAYFRMLDRLKFNDGARAVMLAHSTGTNLDNLGAFWGVQRLIVQAADTSVSPPIPEISESDTALRKRIQLSLEGHTTAGSRGSYLFWALSASGLVKDVSLQSPTPGEVVVTVLSQDGDGVPSSALLDQVDAALNADDVRPLTDNVTVQAATILPYQVEATLTLYEGPDADTVESAAEGALKTYITTHHALGHDITLSGLYGALHQPGVQKVVIAEPADDIVVGPSEAAFCAFEDLGITVGGRDV